MNFALSEDHLVLRQSARTFLEKEISLTRVLVPGTTVEDASYAENWSKIAAMGWPGLVVDETYDGLGLSCIDLAMILGEMGRTLAPSPFLGTLFGKVARRHRRRIGCPASRPARPSLPWPSPTRAARSTRLRARRRRAGAATPGG